jgi:Tat protein translocase TatB subunit
MTLLFIFESIGTSELILIGIVALIVFGPRKLPELARKAGKVMTDLRSTTNEFRDTWQREVDLEKFVGDEPQKTIAKTSDSAQIPPSGSVELPMIRDVDEASIADHFSPENREDASVTETVTEAPAASDKKNWV